MSPRVAQRFENVFGGDKIHRQRQPLAHGERAEQIQYSQNNERRPPAPVRGDDAGEESSKKAAEDRPSHVGGHDRADAPGIFLVDVGHHHGDDAGHENSLREAPEDQGVEALRSRGQQGRHRHGEERRHDDFFAFDGFRNHAGEGRYERHRQRDGAHGLGDGDFRGVEKLLEIRQQRLCAIHVQKRAGPGDHRRENGRFK